MSPVVTLHYFALRCRGELARLILTVGGQAFNEENWPEDEWEHRRQKYPFGVVPVLYWDGEEIGQSTTIARFLAKKVGLAGSNDIEIVRADLVAENANEALCKYWDFRFEEDAAIKARGMAAFKATVLPNFLKQNSVFYQKNGGKFANGKDLSYGDLAIFIAIDTFLNSAELTTGGVSGDDIKEYAKIIKGYPILTGVYDMVKANPKMAEYLAKRPNYDH